MEDVGNRHAVRKKTRPRDRSHACFHDVFDDPFRYVDDDWGIMLAHLWCE